MRKYRRGAEALALHHEIFALIEETIVDMQCEQEEAMAPRQIDGDNTCIQRMAPEMNFWLQVKELS